jgi:mono/diheme cytochrome c family protein
MARTMELGIGLACIVTFLTFTLSNATSEEVLSPAAQRGFVLVRTECSRCHAIGKIGDSPLKIAPPFRTLHEHYPVEDLEEPLAEGIITGHPAMPEFRFDPGQVGDIIAYLKMLEH